MSCEELARELGIGVRQAREFVNSGAVYSFRVGRRVLVPRRAVEALLAGQAPQGAPEREPLP